MEIHCKENLKTAFDFMREKGLPLDIIGGDDIANGNEKLTLGLFWIIISKFQVEDIMLDGVSGKVRGTLVPTSWSSCLLASVGSVCCERGSNGLLYPLFVCGVILSACLLAMSMAVGTLSVAVSRRMRPVHIIHSLPHPTPCPRSVRTVVVLCGSLLRAGGLNAVGEAPDGSLRRVRQHH